MSQLISAYAIKNQWMNFSLYFINFMYKTKRNELNNKVCGHIVQPYRLSPNNNPIGGNFTNNQFLANGEKIHTDFIEVNKEDIINFYRQEKIGLKYNKNDLKGEYKRSENPNSNRDTNITNQERKRSESNIWNDGVSIYFLRGIINNDILKFLVNTKII
jgi:hypothetical protein